MSVAAGCRASDAGGGTLASTELDRVRPRITQTNPLGIEKQCAGELDRAARSRHQVRLPLEPPCLTRSAPTGCRRPRETRTGSGEVALRTRELQLDRLPQRPKLLTNC
jgi:hypothetical protein